MLTNNGRFKGIRVLLMEGSARQVLPMAKGFHNLGCHVTTVFGNVLDLGNWTRYANRKIKIKGVDDDYATAVSVYNNLIHSRKFDFIVPLSDFSAKIAAENKTEWEYNYGVKVAVNDYEIFMRAFDKQQTMDICMKNNIPCPQTFLLEQFDDNIPEIKYPAVVKPRSYWGSIGFHIVNNEEELKKAIQSTNQFGRVLVQEYIPQNGSQFGGEVFRDKNEKFASVLIDEKPRWFPIDGGSPTINVTIHNAQMEGLCKRLLNAMDWNGYANVDLVVDRRDGIAKVIEVNGRVSAGVKLNYYTEIDVAKMFLENAYCNEVTPYLKYCDNKKISCLLAEILWFIKSPNRFKNKPIFLNRANTVDVIFSWADPLPFFVFFIQSIKKYRYAMEQRKR